MMSAAVPPPGVW